MHAVWVRRSHVPVSWRGISSLLWEQPSLSRRDARIAPASRISGSLGVCLFLSDRVFFFKKKVRKRRKTKKKERKQTTQGRDGKTKERKGQTVYIVFFHRAEVTAHTSSHSHVARHRASRANLRRVCWGRRAHGFQLRRPGHQIRKERLCQVRSRAAPSPTPFAQDSPQSCATGSSRLGEGIVSR